MIEDSINNIHQILSLYPHVRSLEVLQLDNLILNYTNPFTEDDSYEIFETIEGEKTATIQLLEWLEEKLPQKV